MKRNHIDNLKIVMILLLFFNAISCDSLEYSTEVDDILQMEEFVFFYNFPETDISDTSWTKETHTGKATRLLIGELEGVKAVTLLKYNDFTGLPDSIEILSANIEMRPVNLIGDSSGSPLLVRLYGNTLDWDENSITDLTINDLIYTQAAIDSEQIEWFTTDSLIDTLRFSISPDLVQSWIDDTDSLGVVLSFEEPADFIAEIPSGKSELSVNGERPFLIIEFVQEGDTAIIKKKYLPSEDGFILEYQSISSDDWITIGGGKANRGRLSFGEGALDTIPEKATIAEAELSLVLDRSTSRIPQNAAALNEPLDRGIPYRLLFSLVDSIAPSGEIVSIDSSAGIVADLPRDHDTLSVDISKLLQKWISKKRDNLGIAVTSIKESSHIYHGNYFSSRNPDLTLRPRMSIFFVKPPVEEF